MWCTVVVLLHEGVVVFAEVGGGWEEGVEFGVENFHGLLWEGRGEGGDGVVEAEDLFVDCGVGG